MFLNEENCFKCGKVTTHYNGNCGSCAIREEQARLDKWKAKSTDEKLLDLHLRLQRLEAGPPML